MDENGTSPNFTQSGPCFVDNPQVTLFSSFVANFAYINDYVNLLKLGQILTNVRDTLLLYFAKMKQPRVLKDSTSCNEFACLHI